ncbi:hypothetical protein NUW54_g13624 [Trametes sanguinea]|uniref:Uncharacterized protein n=1 Tax=Trametes sanguinea TaxID=158606 RepID=A0ACC1MK77_9APHY|nr:hypothetical protein NUW54_g13624 [Trametes sanguinea]
MILSTAASRSIEAVAQANGTGQRWFQLYWPLIPEVTLSLMKRAKDNGYTALVVTLDTMTLGWRPHDIDTAYLPFYHAVGAQVGLTDPVFMKRFGLEPIAHGRCARVPVRSRPNSTSFRYTVLPSYVEERKAIKNETEIRGLRNAYLRDGAAYVRWLAWLDEKMQQGYEITEYEAAWRLTE